MSILDDAIREHLELKRQHGADESDVKKLEDEAFGPPSRDEADPMAEAPTQFMTPEEELGAPETGGRRAPNIADLQEPPPPGEQPLGDELGGEATGAEDPVAGGDSAAAPTEQPAAEHELATDGPAAPDAGLQPDPNAPRPPAAEERPEAADQPTEMFDVEGSFEDTAESASPADEALLAAEQGEPRVTGPVADEPEDEFDDFFSDQRLSDELTRALDEPLDDEPGLPSTEEALAGLPPLPPRTDEFAAPRTDEHDAPAGFEEPSEEAPVPLTEEAEQPHTDDESDFPRTEQHPAPQTDEEGFPATGETELPSGEAPGPLTEEAPSPFLDPDSELGPPPPERAAERDLPEPDSAEADLPAPEPGHEDVLEDTPKFLEDSPEDENAWFEQRPPKDFDFDD
jgi:hypothetical protein